MFVLTLSCASGDDDDSDAAPFPGDDSGDSRGGEDDAFGDDDGTPFYVPLIDADGRQIILHGANFMGLEVGWHNHTLADYRRMASWGFNVVRVPIGWSQLEPAPGVWDESYLADLVAPAVGYAREAGIGILLDMHQYWWCGAYGGEGMPDWTCDAFADLGFPMNYLAGSDDFWNHPEYLDDYVEAWDRVSNYFAGDPAILGYDLFNEPAAGLRSPTWSCENSLFHPLYERLIGVIRANDPAPLIFVEPSVTHLGGLPVTLDRLPYERVVYEPHLYPFEILKPERGYHFTDRAIEWFLSKNQRESIHMGAAAWMGEVGLASAANRAEEYVRDTMRLFDQHLMGWGWWAYGFDDDSMGLLDGQGREKEVFMRHLVRPYPRVTAGRLRAYSFDPDTVEFTMAFENAPGLPPSVEIFVPTARHFTGGFAVTSSDADGTWSHAFDAARNVLTVTCDPATEVHAITIRKP
jgi:endoglycosylceramidase